MSEQNVETVREVVELVDAARNGDGRVLDELAGRLAELVADDAQIDMSRRVRSLNEGVTLQLRPRRYRRDQMLRGLLGLLIVVAIVLFLVKVAFLGGIVGVIALVLLILLVMGRL